MPATHPAAITDGRLNLDQQRKRAKELLQRLRAEEIHAADDPHRPPKLADAQRLVARNLGFTNWPQLKAHCDALAFASRNPGFVADDRPQTHHWRCGNDIQHSLRLAGFKGQFHMLSDPLCMGPVPAVSEDDYCALRSRFISQAFGMDLRHARQRLDGEYASLALLERQAPGVLWCEADAYDQLFLIRVLASLAEVPDDLSLIESDGVPGVQRFIGIGQLAPEVLAWLWPQRRKVDTAMLSLAREAWAAYRAPSPLAWAALAQGRHTALPLLAPALLRQLQELPGLADGLSLTERLALQSLQDLGPQTFGRLFAELMAVREPLPFLGDMMFHALLRPLIDSPRPLIVETEQEQQWTRRTLSLTALGHQVLAGQAYGLDLIGCERWVGGVQLRPGQGHWALDAGLQPIWRD
ncbi:DUF1835 domain-containing protein [Pseudomonas capeferrum]|uniref:DUF1835 domain-containing protein n=1 Tax=Pseudomonas capeferrum TaxID=1495066 RepID=UPI0015E3586E|nr:DUF1835 domain-containing protein [Pseudomonas capeferrum]MBA1200217.1 DUF1835 domain-containing protein [Pseudomonas capeferrum]